MKKILIFLLMVAGLYAQPIFELQCSSLSIHIQDTQNSRVLNETLIGEHLTFTLKESAKDAIIQLDGAPPTDIHFQGSYENNNTKEVKRIFKDKMDAVIVYLDSSLGTVGVIVPSEGMVVEIIFMCIPTEL